LGADAWEGVLSPERVVQRLAGSQPVQGPVVVYDDDHYYVGHCIAELLRAQGVEVTLITPLADVSQWSYYTLELRRLEERLAGAGIRCLTKTRLLEVQSGRIRVAQAGGEQWIDCASLVPVTLREPREELILELAGREAQWRAAGIVSVDAVGDAVAPGTVAAAVYDGARVALELGAAAKGQFLRERVVLE
jgi:dimethylamine/trimethylamine dehydrogenase